MAYSLFEVSLIISAFPTASMIICSYALTKFEVGAKIEAMIQNFAAGLILAAVASELFPVMLGSKTGPSIIGLSVGFVVALALIHGLEYVADKIENPGASTHKYAMVMSPLSMPQGMVGDEEDSMVELTRLGDDGQIEIASRAISSPLHRKHIQEHFKELMCSIEAMETRTKELEQENLESKREEAVAEFIDEQIHTLQYKLDHCRRLLQGSETEEVISPLSSNLSHEKRKRIVSGVVGMKLMVQHLLEHIAEPHITSSVLKEMYIHMDYMDKQINSLHESIEHVGSKWQKSSELAETTLGDTLPVTLIIPVCMDCFVDGLLIGISAAISLKAGIALGIANSLEMGVLGMAYATRLNKCTGSAAWLRTLTLYCPPLMMFIAAGIGALLGAALEKELAWYIALVAFGTVALLFLVCNELLIEAKNAQGEEERWWISSMIFLGIYFVLVLDHLL